MAALPFLDVERDLRLRRFLDQKHVTKPVQPTAMVILSDLLVRQIASLLDFGIAEANTFLRQLKCQWVYTIDVGSPLGKTHRSSPMQVYDVWNTHLVDKLHALLGVGSSYVSRVFARFVAL